MRFQAMHALVDGLGWPIAEVFLDILNNDYDKIKDIQEKYLSE